MRILAIESSCDETAAAVVADGVTILSTVVASSHDMHEKYGGIVPEVAARMQLESVIPVITEALLPIRSSPKQTLTDIIASHIDAVAVTVGPGLIGSLLVGVETAKTIAFITGKPIVPVNHVLAHMYANFVRPVMADNSESIASGSPHPADSRTRDDMFPAISLVVSGGHTELYLVKNEKDLTWLGGTIDDAAGECFDKTARLLGFGHGGGVAIQEAAKKVSQSNVHLPRPMLDTHNMLNFSFSGLKTAIMREVNALKARLAFDETAVNQLAHEIQESITDVLVKKTLRAAAQYNVSSILLSGGVSANVRLREKMASAAGSSYSIHYPPVSLCTDNAVYIASYAFFRGEQTDWNTITAIPDLSVEV